MGLQPAWRGSLPLPRSLSADRIEKLFNYIHLLFPKIMSTPNRANYSTNAVKYS